MMSFIRSSRACPFYPARLGPESESAPILQAAAERKQGNKTGRGASAMSGSASQESRPEPDKAAQPDVQAVAPRVGSPAKSIGDHSRQQEEATLASADQLSAGTEMCPDKAPNGAAEPSAAEGKALHGSDTEQQPSPASRGTKQGHRQQQQQQSRALADKPSSAAAVPGMMAKKGLKERKKDFLKNRKLKKRRQHLHDEEHEDLEAKLLVDPHKPKFGEQAMAPIKVRPHSAHIYLSALCTVCTLCCSISRNNY